MRTHDARPTQTELHNILSPAAQVPNAAVCLKFNIGTVLDLPDEEVPSGDGPGWALVAHWGF
jgi:hypothetical protein